MKQLNFTINEDVAKKLEKIKEARSFSNNAEAIANLILNESLRPTINITQEQFAELFGKETLTKLLAWNEAQKHKKESSLEEGKKPESLREVIVPPQPNFKITETPLARARQRMRRKRREAA